MSFQMYVPTKILFGKGQISNLHLEKMPGKKALIVISNGKSARKNGSLDKTKELLQQSCIDMVIFDQIM